MKPITNRDCLILTPKKPFCDWINGYDEEKIPDENIMSETSVYLIDEIECNSPENIEAYIREYCDEILFNEAFSWYEDDDYIPETLDYALFNEWFDWKYSDLVHDNGRGEIETDFE